MSGYAVSGRRQGTTNPSDVCGECADRLFQVRRFPWSQARNLGTVHPSRKFRRFRILHLPPRRSCGPAVIGSNRPNTGVLRITRGSSAMTCSSAAVVRVNAASMRDRVPLAVLTPAGPWTFPVQSFRIEVPCDNSCDNSWPNGGIHGHSGSVNGRIVSVRKTQNRRSSL